MPLLKVTRAVCRRVTTGSQAAMPYPSPPKVYIFLTCFLQQILVSKSVLKIVSIPGPLHALAYFLKVLTGN